MLEYRYGDDYPANCPPKNAKSADYKLYRACNTDIEIDGSLNIENFIPVYETTNRTFPPHQVCQAKALSFFDDLETIKKKILDFPNIGDRIIRVKLNGNCGVVQGPRRNHYSLWDYIDPTVTSAIGNNWEEVHSND